MTRHSVQPRDRIFVKANGFLFFAKNIGKNISKNISINMSGKCSQKRLGHAKQSATYVFKTASKRLIQKTAEAADDLIGNKIADKTTEVSKNSQQNNSKKITNENNKEMPKEIPNLEKDIYLHKKDKKLLIILILM